MGRRWEGRGTFEENQTALVDGHFNVQECDKRVMPRTFRLAGIVLSVLEPETVRELGGRFPSAHAKKSQSCSGPPPHFQNLRPLFAPSFWTVRSTAGELQSQLGWSGFEFDMDGGGREGWTGDACRRGGSAAGSGRWLIGDKGWGEKAYHCREREG